MNMTNYSIVCERINTIINCYGDGSFPRDMVISRFTDMDSALTGALDLSLLTLEQVKELKEILWNGYEVAIKNI